MSTNKKLSKSSISLKEVLDDLSSRFILNCPEEEYQSFERLYFQIEEAFWFYMDFYRVKYSNLPALSLKKFGQKIFEHCPLLFQYYHAYDEVFDLFNEYKCSVPVMGALMLNPDMSKVVLVQGWKSRTWSFPRGKISRAESEEHCAIREVQEETGYDISSKLRPEHYIERTLNHQQHAKMFIITNVSEDTVFKTQTRNEIRNIDWFSLSKLNNWKSNKNSPFVKKHKLYKVLTFIRELNLWIANEKKGKHNKTRKRSNSQYIKPTIPIMNNYPPLSNSFDHQDSIPHPKSMPNLEHTACLSKPININNSKPYSASQQQQQQQQQQQYLNQGQPVPIYQNKSHYSQDHQGAIMTSLTSQSMDSFFNQPAHPTDVNSMSGFKFDTQDLLGVLNQ